MRLDFYSTDYAGRPRNPEALRDLYPSFVDLTRLRTKASHPYSYDPFFLWGNNETAKSAQDALYSDRIWQWDREKAERCWKSACPGKRWDTASQAQISQFCSEYWGKPLRAVALAEGCNVSNGYPYWIVWIKPASSDPA